MKKKFFDGKILVVYSIIIVIILLSTIGFNYTVTTVSNEIHMQNTVIIDAGHGGVDSGAVSCTGIYESALNLEIALKLNDLMHLLGIRTVMIRDSDRSVYTSGNTIASKKISDIKERVRITNSTSNALLLSIHQNNFSESRYWGAQVFYNNNPGSKDLAERLQSSFRANLSPQNKRQIKKSNGVFLMEHVNCPGVLIECGFLSNPAEEQKLRSDDYQSKISCVIASTVSQYLNT